MAAANEEAEDIQLVEENSEQYLREDHGEKDNAGDHRERKGHLKHEAEQQNHCSNNDDYQVAKEAYPEHDQEHNAKQLQQQHDQHNQSRQQTRMTRGKKSALIFAYLGAGFQGMQRNPGANTVEGTLEEALRHSGCVENADECDFSKLSWSRAARTDKGVSATGQVVAFRMREDVAEEPEENIVNRINSNLPRGLRTFGCLLTTSSFNARTACDSRKYEYVAPLYVFDPSAYRSKALQESLKISQKREYDPDFTFDSSMKQRFNGLLYKFVGTHNFHNFTVRASPTDASVTRYIMDFQCGDPFTIDGMQCVPITVHGQSFMLHQIRKMVGTAIAVIRGDVSESRIDLALASRAQVTTPMAPETGLFLAETHFRGYNRKWGSYKAKIDVSAYSEQIAKFKWEFIYPHLVQIERKEGVYAHWLRSMNTSTLHQAPAPPSAAQRLAEKKRLEQQQQEHQENGAAQGISIANSPPPKKRKRADPKGAEIKRGKRNYSTYQYSFDPEVSDS